MFRSVFTKTLYDKRWMIFGWSIGLATAMIISAAVMGMRAR